MKQIQTIIIDDEPLVREDLRHLLAGHEDIVVTGEAGTVDQAKKLLRNTRADVVFLDIQLLGGTGFDLVPEVPSGTRIIFFTSYDEYALRAFEVNALDYLLKPVSAERLNSSLKRVRGRQVPVLNQGGGKTPLTDNDKLFLSTGKKNFFTSVKTICAITTAGGNYSFAHLENGEKHMVRRTVKQWEVILPIASYLRIHRATIIRLDSIQTINKGIDGSYTVVVKGAGEALCVSRRSIPRLRQAFPL